MFFLLVFPFEDAARHETYRERLGVPTFDPRQGTASAPLWYVTEDPEVLYRLRTAGIERWGIFGRCWKSELSMGFYRICPVSKSAGTALH